MDGTLTGTDNPGQMLKNNEGLLHNPQIPN